MSYEKTRLTIMMNRLEILQAMSEGNPGALGVLCNLIKEGATIDPDDAFEGFGALMGLDDLDCYGSRIWLLYKDVCGQKVRVLVALLRAVQLGILSGCTLQAAIDGTSSRVFINIPEVLALVKAQLPRFQLEAPAPVAAAA